MKSSETNSFKNFFVYNWKRKLISLIIATGVWFWVNSLDYTEQTASLPISFQNIPEDMMILETSDEIVTFTIRIHNNKVSDMEISHLVSPYVDLSNAVTGYEYYPIQMEITDSAPEMNINMMKEEVKVHLDNIATQEVQIKPRIIGTPVSGFMVDSIQYEPEYITIKGPEDDIGDIEYLETETIDIGDTSESLHETVFLVIPENFEVIGDSTVTVSITYIEKTSSKEISLPVEIVNLDNNYEIVGDPEVTLIVEIPDSFSANYVSKISVTMDCSSVDDSGKFILPLTVTTSSGIEIVDSPDFATIQVESLIEEVEESTNL